MFKQLLVNTDKTFNITTGAIFPGVQAFYFSFHNQQMAFPVSTPVKIQPDKFEVLFCLNGSFVVNRNDGDFIVTDKDEILLLSDSSYLRSIQLTAPLTGILLVIDKDPYFNKPFSSVDEEDTKQLRLFMQHHSNCILFQNSLWIQSLFVTLKQLKRKEQYSYCLLKTTELLFLLRKQDYLFFDESASTFKNNFLTNTIRNMKQYMEEHLDEKLTIDHMSNLFHISSTTFKLSFRHLYGQPVHTWLQTQRMKQAAEYLHSSSMSILQIAQSVGYEGVSQFNVSFKRHYGMTPTQYKKMSYNGENNPIP